MAITGLNPMVYLKKKPQQICFYFAPFDFQTDVDRDINVKLSR